MPISDYRVCNGSQHHSNSECGCFPCYLVSLLPISFSFHECHCGLVESVLLEIILYTCDVNQTGDVVIISHSYSALIYFSFPLVLFMLPHRFLRFCSHPNTIFASAVFSLDNVIDSPLCSLTFFSVICILLYWTLDHLGHGCYWRSFRKSWLIKPY